MSKGSNGWSSLRCLQVAKEAAHSIGSMLVHEEKTSPGLDLGESTFNEEEGTGIEQEDDCPQDNDGGQLEEEGGQGELGEEEEPVSPSSGIITEDISGSEEDDLDEFVGLAGGAQVADAESELVANTPGPTYSRFRSRAKKELKDIEPPQVAENAPIEGQAETESSETSDADVESADAEAEDALSEGERTEEDQEHEEKEEETKRKSKADEFVVEDKVRKINLSTFTKWRLRKDQAKKNMESKRVELKIDQRAMLEEYTKRKAQTLADLEAQRADMEKRWREESGAKCWRRVSRGPRKVFVRRRNEEFIRFIKCRPYALPQKNLATPPKCAATGQPAKYRTRTGVPFADLAAYQSLFRKRKVWGDGRVQPDLVQTARHQNQNVDQNVTQPHKKRIKVKRMGPQVCVVTGAPNAKYCHPRTGLPYATVEAFARLEVVWQSGGLKACIQEFDLISVETAFGQHWVTRRSRQPEALD